MQQIQNLESASSNQNLIHAISIFKSSVSLDLEDFEKVISDTSFASDAKYSDISDPDDRNKSFILQKITKLKVPKYQTLDKDKKIKSQNCSICDIPNTNKNFCRGCGKQQCNPCFRRKINDNKVCDICFTKLFCKKTINKKKMMLNNTKQNFESLEQALIGVENTLFAQQIMFQKMKKEDVKEDFELINQKKSQLSNIVTIVKMKKDIQTDVQDQINQKENIIKDQQINKVQLKGDIEGIKQQIIKEKERNQELNNQLQVMKQKANSRSILTSSGSSRPDIDFLLAQDQQNRLPSETVMSFQKYQETPEETRKEKACCLIQ